MERQKIIPPVPKFNLAASDIFENQQLAKKRTNSLKETICEVICKLKSQLQGRALFIEKRVFDLIQPSLLIKLKNRKAISIALAMLAYVCCTEEIQLSFDEFCLSNKKIQKIKLIIEDHYSLTSFKQHKITSEIIIGCQILGLNEKFQKLCLLTIQYFYKYKLFSSISFKIIAGLILKFMGDLIFHRRGGLSLDCIAISLRCKIDQLESKILLIEPYAIKISEELAQNPAFQEFFQ